MARRHLEQQVADPALREKLTPRYEIGCKRILMSNEYFPALQQPNAELVTDAIARDHADTASSRADGVEHPADAIVCGTGFRVTDMPYVEWLRGRDGRTLGDVWREQGHAGAARHDRRRLPEPVHARRAEHRPRAQLDRLHDRVAARLRDGRAAHDGRARRRRARHAPEAQAAFNDGCSGACAGPSGRKGGCASWYLDAHGRNTTLWPGSSWTFRRATRRFDVGRVRAAAAGAGDRPALAGVC